jgi:hypothetical protein
MAPHFLNVDTRWSFNVSRTKEQCLSSGKFYTNIFFLYVSQVYFRCIKRYNRRARCVRFNLSIDFYEIWCLRLWIKIVRAKLIFVSMVSNTVHT